MDRQRIAAMFAAVDSRDVKQFIAFTSADVELRFASAPSVRGHAAVAAALRQMYDYVTFIEHALLDIWNFDDIWIVEMHVTYIDIYGRNWTYPACNVMRSSGDVMSNYRIYVDNQSMFSPPAP